MKILKLILALGMLIGMYMTSRAQEGEQLFRGNCASCHSIGKGKLVGPDLKDIHSRFDQQWLEKWVKSSQGLIKSGDELAIKVYNENNKVPMPDVMINDDQIKTVLAYIKEKSSESVSASTTPVQTQADNSGGASAVAESVTSINMFSFTEYLLLGLCALLLIIVWVMSKTIRTLSIELGRKYESDDYV